jgi:pilus assembly protein CpaC
MTKKSSQYLDGAWLRGIRASLLGIIVAAAIVPLAGAQTAAPAPKIITRVDDSRHAGTFVVPFHQSQILRLNEPFTSLSVGEPKIADVLPLTDRSIYVLGKELGTTSLTIYGRNNSLIAVADITVSFDIEGLKRRLFELMPEEKIEVRPADGALILSGFVTSGKHASQILEVAGRYGQGKITNLLAVKGSQQVMLSVRFAEVGRSVVKDLGLNTGVQLNSRTNTYAITSGDALLRGAIAATSFATGVTSAIRLGNVTLNLLFDALEKKGAVKTLAEPNLIALSGDTASFLAGGEFPVPVAQAGAAGGAPTITIEYKAFGVALAFTPTVIGDDLINILVSPEVSRIDPNNSITLAGFQIPGLTTRRAKTTVELRDGESFAIAGLLQNDFQDTVRQFPLLADIPILGALLRSTDFQRNETELVIIVTPHLVKPSPPGALTTPADRFVLPSDLELFGFGRVESSASGLPASTGTLNRAGAGGVEGRYGHIIK